MNEGLLGTFILMGIALLMFLFPLYQGFLKRTIMNYFKFRKNLKKTIHSHQFHHFSKLNAFDLLKMFKIFWRRRRWLEQLSPTGQELIRKFCQNPDNFRYIAKFREGYKKSTKELINQALMDKELSDFEKERLVYELKIQERYFLEKYLPESHPLQSILKEGVKISLHDRLNIIK